MQAEEYIRVLFSRTNYIEMAFVEGDGQDVSNQLMGNGNEPALVSVLLDCLEYDFPLMINTTMRLLNRFWSTRYELCQRAVQAQVLVQLMTFTR